MAPMTANEVADYILCNTQNTQGPVSNLKLQKLVYYAQAWFLALYDEPLFDDEIQAWVHGPVQPELYHRFKSFRWEPISGSVECPEFSREIQDHMDEVLGVYGGYSAHQIERIVHQEYPWKNARGGLSADLPSAATISHEDMKNFYRHMAGVQGESDGKEEIQASSSAED